MFLTCGNCQLICHREKEERKRRYKMLKESGVVVQNEDSSFEALSPEEDKQRMQKLPSDRRAFYETV
jgi:epoxyqueuosine reductase